MSNANSVNGNTAASYVTTGVDAGMATMSPDSLLAYCQMQLGDLDGQINDQMSEQQTALREREALQSAQNVLGQFGTAGPTSAADMEQCVTAVNNAIAQLPPGDPVAVQLASFRDNMCSQYQYAPGRPLTADEQQQLTQAQQVLHGPNPNVGDIFGNLTTQLQAQTQVATLEQTQNGTLGKAPDAGAKQWQGTTDALASIADDVKSSAEIQMLHLQDLVSQRQQAIQLCSGIMSKADQTLEEQAKAIGQG